MTDTKGSETGQAWLGSTIGQELLAAEQRVIDEALDGVFGEHLLQIGRWGPDDGLISHSRTQHSVTVYSRGQPGQVVADFARLPFANDSVDAILLPHTLELSSRPHDILREAHRVLRSEGHLMILGFKPVGFWGLRRWLSKGKFPPGIQQVIGDRKLDDWMQLLDLRVQDHKRFLFRLPVSKKLNLTGVNWERFGRRWWPELAACYWMQARKRVATITPIRPSWRSRARVVSGLAKPSMRDAVKSVVKDD
ncbi:MAG: class I SAM-dependent methyltransferase [Pseudomonadota bacterium]